MNYVLSYHMNHYVINYITYYFILVIALFESFQYGIHIFMQKLCFLSGCTFIILFFLGIASKSGSCLLQSTPKLYDFERKAWNWNWKLWFGRDWWRFKIIFARWSRIGKFRNQQNMCRQLYRSRYVLQLFRCEWENERNRILASRTSTTKSFWSTIK